jgi:TetR/AcrR family transcriptional regulator, mexJK operon transcriptional repressor
VGRRSTVTRERVLRAAFARFSSYGFRRTSMEDIALEAGVSRAALYLQFANKEEIFRALSRELHDRALEETEKALRGDAPLGERLHAAALAKSLRFVEIASGSPHGSELLDENSRLCGDLSLEGERRFRDLLARELRRAEQAGEIQLAALELTPHEAAILFARAASGLKGPTVALGAYRKHLAAWVRVFVRGLKPREDASRRPAARRRGRATARQEPPV